MKLQTVIPALAILLSGCVSDPASVRPVVPVPSAKGVYVVNEGNFGRANASLSYYDLESFRAYNDVFTAVNRRPLGDVATGMVLRGSRGYIVVNNSNAIEVIDLTNNLSAGTISTGPGTSPRRLAFVNDSVALVTNLYDNSVGIVDLSRGIVTGTVPVGANPDGIAIVAGKAFVANSGFGSGATVTVLDCAALPPAVLTTLTVGAYPSGVRMAASGRVYVVCGGSYGDYSNPGDDTPASIYVIDPVSVAVVDSLPVGGHAFDIAVNMVDGLGYVATTDSVIRFDTKVDRRLGLFLPGNFYAAGVEEVSGDVYLADPKNYTQPGTVEVYSATGQLRTSFDVGIIPGWFAFKR